MFVFKKIVSAFLLPIPIGLFLLFLAFFYLMFNSYKKAKWFLFFSFIWFVLISNQTFSNAIIKPLENSHKALIITPKVEYIVVLGSGHHSNENLSITSQLSSTAINRLIEGIKHYKNLSEVKLILSGYKGFDKNSHASIQEKLAVKLGVNKNDIIRLDFPKDANEEAIYTKKIVDKKPFILVTSASHMKRAMFLFQKQGLTPIASPTQHLNFEDEYYSTYFSSKNIRKVELAFHEYIGLLWAYIRGLI